MTELLFLDDPYMTDFQAVVLSCTATPDGFSIELDRTAFYPEGGGQPWDIGYLNDIEVHAVVKENGHVFHITTLELKTGTNVSGRVDWEHRLELMQQHTGQHMISAAAWKLFNAKTIGFHLTLDNLTIDLDCPLSHEERLQLENQANHWIWENHPISAHYPNPEDLSSLPLRKQPKVSSNIRIIEIEAIDLTPCGGTHLKATGEVGIVKILKSERYKGGTRLFFAAGRRALSELQSMNDTQNMLVSAMKAPADQLVDTWNKASDQLKETKRELRTLRERFAKIEAAELIKHGIQHPDGYTIIRKAFSSRDMSEIRTMANTLIEEQACVILFGSAEADASRLLFTRSKHLTGPDIKPLFSEAIEQLDGRGGGNSQSAQGGGKHPELLDEVLQTALDKLLGI